MLLLIWLVLCVLAGSIILLPFALRLGGVYNRYSGSRSVACPEDQQSAAVSIDARHAAATGIDGHPDLRLCDCTRWPERLNCNQSCLSHAVEAEPYAPVKVNVRKKQIYHLPIIVAAFAAWYVGAIWHSQYLFRTRWTDTAGLSRAEVKQIVWWVSPHLLTAAICLLFAYGVAWLLAVSHRKGVVQGVLMSVLLFGAVVATCSFAIAGLPNYLILLEAGYAFAAAVTVGAIIGGLQGRLVLRSQ